MVLSRVSHTKINPIIISTRLTVIGQVQGLQTSDAVYARLEHVRGLRGRQYSRQIQLHTSSALVTS